MDTPGTARRSNQEDTGQHCPGGGGRGYLQGGAAQRTRVQSIGHTGQHSPGGGGLIGFGHARHSTAEQSGGHTGQHCPGGGGRGLSHGGLMQAMLQTIKLRVDPKCISSHPDRKELEVHHHHTLKYNGRTFHSRNHENGLKDYCKNVERHGRHSSLYVYVFSSFSA